MSLIDDLLGWLTPDAIGDFYDQELPDIKAPDVSFKPFTVSGGFGSITGGPGGTSYKLDADQQAMADALFSGAGDFFTAAQVDPAVREQAVYDRMLSAMAPDETRRRLELEERMLAQGRGGIRTAQFGGAPEQLAMEKAIQESRNQAYLGAMQQAQAQQAQQASLGSQFLQQSYAPQAAMLSAFSPALNVAGMADVARRQQGELGLEAQMANANLLLGQQQGKAGLYAGLYGNVLSGLGGLFSSALGAGQDKPWWWPFGD